MKNKKEIMALGVVNPSEKNVLTRLFYSGKITDCMQLRCKTDETFTLFQCGVDVQTLKNGDVIVTTTLGVWGYNFKDLVNNILKLTARHLSYGYYWYLVDDSENLFGDKYEYDEDGNAYLSSPSTAAEHIITDEKVIKQLCRGIEEIQ